MLLKLLSTRDRDVEDAASIVTALGTKLDRALVDDETERLAADTPDHDILARLARLPR